MATKSLKKGFPWLTLVSTFFALTVCVTTSGMIYIVYPHTSQFVTEFFRQYEENPSEFAPTLDDTQQEKAFVPQVTETFSPTEMMTPEPTFTPIPSPTTTQEPTQIPQITPTPAETPTPLPDSAYINGITGSQQLYTLDCESQAAVDWARFFGVRIDEQDFIDRLPRSDDPNKGFVGNINGPMGQIPPGDYGVYAKPVAKLLRQYGLKAKAVNNWDIESIKREIVAGRPVIVWIVNLPFAINPSEYTPPGGKTTVVAPFQHTWIITGYNSYSFAVIDSEWTYNVKTATLEERWDVFGNQAIIFHP